MVSAKSAFFKISFWGGSCSLAALLLGYAKELKHPHPPSSQKVT
jgi:hypothetical protein